MTFVEELRTISDKVELQHKLDRQFTELKSKMRATAAVGYRTFQIEVVSLRSGTRSNAAVADNCFVIYTSNREFYRSKLFDFLAELGFSDFEIECVDHLTDYKKSTHFTVAW